MERLWSRADATAGDGRRELAEPSQFVVGGSYEHFWFEGHAVTRQVHDELLAYLGSPLDPHGRIPLAVAGEIDQDIPYRLFRGVDVNVRVDHDARHLTCLLPWITRCSPLFRPRGTPGHREVAGRVPRVGG